MSNSVRPMKAQSVTFICLRANKLNSLLQKHGRTVPFNVRNGSIFDFLLANKFLFIQFPTNNKYWFMQYRLTQSSRGQIQPLSHPTIQNLPLFYATILLSLHEILSNVENFPFQWFLNQIYEEWISLQRLKRSTQNAEVKSNSKSLFFRLNFIWFFHYIDYSYFLFILLIVLNWYITKIKGNFNYYFNTFPYIIAG
jgi:hypothetical protein